jgi:hypothetical protein
MTCAVAPRLAGATGAPPDSDLELRCADIHLYGIDRQQNVRAGLIRERCGLESFASARGKSLKENRGVFGVEDYGGVDIDVSGPDPSRWTWHSTSMVWSTPDNQTIVVHYNDSIFSRQNYSGVSVSFDAGATFIRLWPPPFATGHGTNLGSPVVVYNRSLNQWFAGDLAIGCGGQGIGLWTSVDAMTWTVGACAHSGGIDDRESMWVDNNPDSPYFGRMYISWNDFAVSGSPLSVIYSDNGVSWSTPVRITATFIRNVQLSGSPTDGTVVIAGMDEQGGGPTRTNWSYVSTDGGSTWQSTQMGPDFEAPGAPGCGYFWRVAPNWRYMGWGQPAVGPNGIIHYAYAGHGVNPGDLGDIYYVRSVDNGQTWSDPIILNTDHLSGGTTEQWMPSVSVTAGGDVFVSWYDRRNTTDGSNYEFWGIESPDNGETWLADMAVSDVISPQPTFPDCDAGDYNYHTASGATHFITWMDGREIVEGQSQQNVFFDQVPTTP